LYCNIMSIRSPDTAQRQRGSARSANAPSFLELGQYKEALNQINVGYQNLTDLSNFIKERAQIEQDYANSLKKWANKYGDVIRKGGEYNTCRGAWMGSLNEARSLADQHTCMSQALLAQAQKKVSSHQKDNYSKKVLGGFNKVADYEKEFMKAQKGWSQLYKKQTKAKQKYHDACMAQRSAEKALEGLHIQLEQAGSTGKDKEPIRVKYERQKTVVTKKEEEVVKTRDNYKEAVLHCNDGRDTYENGMKAVYDKTQKDEEGRLQFVREILFDIHQKLNISESSKLREIYTHNENTLLKLDVNSDIEWWHNTKGMGVAMQWPTFDEFDPLSAQNTIAHNQSKRSTKHVAGGSEINTMSYRQNGTNFADEFNSSNGALPTSEPPKYASPEKLEINSVSAVNPFDREINNNKEPAANAAGDPGNFMTSKNVEVIYDYEAQEDDEISLAAGMRLLEIEAEDDQGWCKGRLDDGSEGLYPANYVRPV